MARSAQVTTPTHSPTSPTPADVSGGSLAAPSGMNVKRTVTAYAAMIVALAVAGVFAVGMHQRANAAPVEPTWQQGVVTVDDARTVELAQAWPTPFKVVYAAEADVAVQRVDLTGAGKAGGDLRGVAETVTDGDRITGCTLRLDPVAATDATIVHEFGHCLGLGHLYTAQSHSVMVNGGVEDREHGSATVTDFDRAALADLYAR